MCSISLLDFRVFPVALIVPHCCTCKQYYIFVYLYVTLRGDSRVLIVSESFPAYSDCCTQLLYTKPHCRNTRILIKPGSNVNCWPYHINSRKYGEDMVKFGLRFDHEETYEGQYQWQPV